MPGEKANMRRQQKEGDCAAVASENTVAATLAPALDTAMGVPTLAHAPDWLVCTCWCLMPDPLEYDQ